MHIIKNAGYLSNMENQLEFNGPQKMFVTRMQQNLE